MRNVRILMKASHAAAIGVMDKNIFVGGIVSLTTIDYPDHLSVVVFLQGCPWRCVYCHNRHLQSISASESLPWEDVLNVLKARSGFVDAVVFSGGEPLMQESIGDAIAEVRALGFKVGLHTAGAFPDRLSQIVSSIDWVGFDVKHAFNSYGLITSVESSGDKALASLKILLESGTDFEARLTMHNIIDTDTAASLLKDMAQMGVKKVAIQRCRDMDDTEIDHAIFANKELLDELSTYFESFIVR